MKPVDNKLLCPPEAKAEREIENQGHVAEYFAEFVSQGRTRITEGVLLDIHRLTIEGIYPCAGNYRDARTRVEITGTKHKPSHPAIVQSDVRDMLEWLYDGGRNQSPMHRAAYVLWKVNAIHPFNGGNGRVARALAYLIILVEVAPVFAGESLPTKLKARKAEYLNALQAADNGSLGPLEQLVLECFQAQLNDIARRAGRRKDLQD
jgi:fido (protein-threonine AMPylation protein)